MVKCFHINFVRNNLIANLSLFLQTFLQLLKMILSFLVSKSRISEGFRRDSLAKYQQVRRTTQCILYTVCEELKFVLHNCTVHKLTIGSCVSVRSSRYEACGKFGEHKRCIRVARGIAERNSY